jgi:hypothetical protein
MILSFSFADTTNVGRIVVLRWNQDDSSSAPASVGDLLQTVSPWSPYNRDNFRAKKFSVIYDRCFFVGATGPNISGDRFVKKMNSQIAFQATATTGTGHLYAFMVSDSTAVAHPVFSFIGRVSYTDS